MKRFWTLIAIVTCCFDLPLESRLQAADPAKAGTPAAAESQPPVRNRLVRVMTVSQEGLRQPPGAATVEATLALLQQASTFRPDIVCLPEAFSRGDDETLAGPTIKRVGAWARQQGCYVICPLHLKDGERKYNSAVLLDRQGEVVGRYDKIRPTEDELKAGIWPGAKDPPVFRTDFGLIGIQICFDVNWTEQWQSLKQKGAKLVFFSAAYPAARQLAALAWQNQYFVVSCSRTLSSSIYDITGDRLASTGKYQPWLARELPLDKQVFEVDFHVEKMKQIEQKYGSRVKVTWYHEDDLITLASLDPDLIVADLIKQYGLTPHPAYMQRAQQAQDALRGPAQPRR